MCKLEFKSLSQFFQRRRHFSSQAKLLSTTQRWGIKAKACNSLRLAMVTDAPIRLFDTFHKGLARIASARQNNLYPV